MLRWEYIVRNIDKQGKPVALLVDNQNNTIYQVFEGYTGYTVQSKTGDLKPMHITYDRLIERDIECNKFETREESLENRLKRACKLIEKQYRKQKIK